MTLILSGTDGLSDVDGSAATPAIRGTDANTGIFFPAADTIAFSEGGTESMRIDSSGNVGIGTASPARLLSLSAASPILRMTETGANSDLDFIVSTNSGGLNISVDANNEGANSFCAVSVDGSERMRIDSSGNVGIGTSSPDIYSQGGKMFTVSNTATNSYAYTTLAGSGSGGGELDFGNQTIRHASIASLSGSSLAFYTNSTNSGTAVSQRMTIDSSGNLLVGTTSASLTVGEGFKAFYNSGTNPYVGAVMSSSTNSQTNYHLYSTGASAYRFYVGLAGTVFATNTTITGISDERLKENIRDLDDGLTSVMALKPRKFDWKEGKGANTKNARGFIAQEFETVFPDMIEQWKDPAPEGEEPYKAVNANLIPTLVKAIQEQQALITTLTDRITALEAK